VNDSVELAGGGKVGAERFFNNDACPTSLPGLVQADGFEMF
jgi:hypothetical protein